MNRYHIIPKDGAWLLRREGGLRRDESFAKKKKAIHAGRQMLRLVGGALVIHGKSGEVKKRRTFKPAVAVMRFRPFAVQRVESLQNTPASGWPHRKTAAA